MNRLAVGLSVASLVLVAGSGCELFLQNTTGQLPPSSTLIIPSPTQRGADSGQQQAACDNGNDVVTAVEARITELNAAVESSRALFTALYSTTPQAPIFVDDVANYTVEVGSRTMNVRLVDQGDDVIINADIDIAPVFTGKYKKNGSEGNIIITPDGEDAITSNWTTNGGSVDIVRTVGLGTFIAAFSDDGDNAKLGLAGLGDFVPLVAVWNLADGSGAAIEGENVEAGCWTAGTAVGDMCSTLCEDAIVDLLPSLPSL